MSNHLQHITAQAKRIRQANPHLPWTECISLASKQIAGAGVGRKPKYKVYAREVKPRKRKAKAKKEQLLLPAPSPTMVAPKVRKPKKSKRIAPVVPKVVAPKVVKPKVVKAKVVKPKAKPIKSVKPKAVSPVTIPQKSAPGSMVYPKIIPAPKRKKEPGVYYDDSLYRFPQIDAMDFNQNYTIKYFTNDHKLALDDLKKGFDVFGLAKNKRFAGAYFQLQAKDIEPLVNRKVLDGRSMLVDTDAPFFRYAIAKHKKGSQKVAGTSRKILSVDQFDKFARSKGFNPKFADTDKFVAFMFKYSKDLFGRSSLKGMSWNAIYNLNPMSADWISWSKIDTDTLERYIRQNSKAKGKIAGINQAKLDEIMALYVNPGGLYTGQVKFRAKILWGEPIVLVETNTNQPIDKIYTDDMEEARLLAEVLNQRVVNSRKATMNGNLKRKIKNIGNITLK